MTEAVRKKGWRGSEEVWLNAAYELLIKGGVEAVKVSALSKALNLSRASFYWHFEDREALLDGLITRWQDKNTGNLIAQTQSYAETITEAMLNVFDCWIRPDLFDSDLDFAIRNWAHADPALDQILRGADQDRIRALTVMFERFGVVPETARIRALTTYYTQIGYISMKVEEPLTPRIQRMPQYVEQMTGHPPSESEVRRFFARHAVLMESA